MSDLNYKEKSELSEIQEMTVQTDSSVRTGKRIVPTTEWNNCGGRCRLLLHMDGDKIEKITGDPDYPDLMPCIKGIHAAETFLGPDRLLYPMRRVGKRGEGKFERISWQEAIDEIAAQWIRIRDAYGPASRYVNYGWGVSACMSGLRAAKRLLRLDGGHLDYYNSYSTACTAYTTPYMYGTNESGSTYDTLLDSKLIILWAHNPAETRFDNLMYWLRRAKEKGIPMIVIDPRRNATVDALGAEWIGLRPGTDAALMDAMAYVIYTENLYDSDFVQNHCQGFTADTLPEGTDPTESYFAYLTGAQDGIARTPQWGEVITGVKAEIIIDLARRYATAEAAALLQGYGGQRHLNGEQFTRGGIMLACLTGNVGFSGGWASGAGYRYLVEEPKLPSPANPVEAEIPVYGWTMAVQEPERMDRSQGLHGADCLESGIKMILNLAGNALINQHGDIHRTEAILQDETKCEFILCSDLFMTPSARYADILLPGVSMFEMNNITSPWSQGNYLTFCNKVMNPLGESRDDYDWLAEVAARIGLYDEFTQGHATTDDWLRDIYETMRRDGFCPAHLRYTLNKRERIEHQPQTPAPDYDTFRQQGILRFPERRQLIAFENRIFPTASGKVDIYSPQLAAMGDSRIPAIPRYLPDTETEWWKAHSLTENHAIGEETDSPEEIFPLRLIGWHTGGRTHSIHDNNPTLQNMYPQQLWIHPSDAEARGIREGNLVRVYNQRGCTQIAAHVTEDIVPGCVAMAQGAWYRMSHGDRHQMAHRESHGDRHQMAHRDSCQSSSKDSKCADSINDCVDSINDRVDSINDCADSIIDLAGSINVLISQEMTPLAHGNGQHTCGVEVNLIRR